jgi:hypothetical protein
MPVSQEQLHDAYSDLYDALNQAYWVASTIEDKDSIHDMAEAVYGIISDLNAADIKSRNDDYQALTKSVTTVNTRLKDLQTEIASIIHKVDVATQVVSATAKVLSLASEFIAI